MSHVKKLVLIACSIFFFSCGKNANTYVEILTEYGTMKVMLYNETPTHRDNFVKLVKKGFYNDLLFHRVIESFMVQGGDPDSKDAGGDKLLGQGGPGYELDAEIKMPHVKGALAAARLSDEVNPERKSNGSQFFMVHGRKYTDEELDRIEQMNGVQFKPEERAFYKETGGAPFLDGQYTVFGQVVEGIAVLDKIASVPTGLADRPMRNIKMKIKVL